MPGLSERAAVPSPVRSTGSGQTALPLLIEAGLHQRLAERSAIWVVEYHALRSEAGDQRVVQRLDVGALERASESKASATVSCDFAGIAFQAEPLASTQ